MRKRWNCVRTVQIKEQDLKYLKVGCIYEQSYTFKLLEIKENTLIVEIVELNNSNPTTNKIGDIKEISKRNIWLVRHYPGWGRTNIPAKGYEWANSEYALQIEIINSYNVHGYGGSNFHAKTKYYESTIIGNVYKVDKTKPAYQ
jgi:hypothetical protein